MMLRLPAVLFASAMLLGVSGSRAQPTMPAFAVLPEASTFAADLLSARRENVRLQRSGDPAAKWMFVKP